MTLSPTFRPFDDLHSRSIILPDDHGDQVGYVAIRDDSELQSLAAEDESGSGHDVGLNRGRRLEMNLRERTGKQLAVPVVHIDLNQQGAAGRIDGVGGADQGSLKRLARIFRKSQVELEPSLCGVHVELRHIGVDAKGLNGLHVKELSSGALIDQLAGIDITGGDHAIEGGIDLFERNQLA